MSVSLNPSSSLGFNRPFTILVKRSLTITNHNVQPIAFKVKTTAPKLYCVRPNSGRVDPGESVEVAVMLQAMKEEPPLNQKCKDKFLIQSTIITPEKETMALQDMWNIPEGSEENKVYQQKLRVVYLPPEGQVLEEEDEGPAQPHPGQPTLSNLNPMYNTERRYSTAAARAPNGHGHPPPIPDFPINQEPLQHQDSGAYHEVHHQIPPPTDFSARHDESLEHTQPLDAPGFVSVTAEQEHQSFIPPPASMPEPQLAAPSMPVPPVLVVQRDPSHDELLTKYNQAQAEIERLRALLAAAPLAPPPTELRRRTRALSDAGSDTGETTVGTLIDDGSINQEGVPLQVVVIIALGVFITTYLFF